MTITLTREQESWIRARVANGEFLSVEAAARQLIDERIADLSQPGHDDLAWAKPYVAEARAGVARGEFVSLDEHKAHNAALLASFRE